MENETNTKSPANGRSVLQRFETPLARKLVKAVAAAALGVGSALLVKRRKHSAEPRIPASSTTSPAIPPTVRPTHEEIALRAYFISEERRIAGFPADPHRDWIDAELELLARFQFSN